MPRTQRSAFPFTLKELAAARRTEDRPAIRKRILALEAVLRGRKPDAAARAAGMSANSVYRWMARARREGLAAMLYEGRAAHRRKFLTAEEIATARREIAAALRRSPYWWVRQRLIGIDAYLSGQPEARAAAIAMITPERLRKWIGKIRRESIIAVLAKYERPRGNCRHELHANAELFREAAAREWHPKVKRGLLALAYVADGASVDDAAVRAGVSSDTVVARIRRFRARGLDGVTRHGA
jgi:transposase